MTLSLPADTALGGFRREFPSTCWSRFRNRAAAGPLFQSYWKPVFAYIRAKWGKPVEDAKDLTQDFFAWMVETDFLSRVDPARGRFRAFVKTALANYVVSQERRRTTVKRGGGQEPLRFGDGPLPDAPGAAPESALDAAWRREILQRAAAAVEASLRAEGRELAFLLFRDFYLAETEAPTYRQAMERHGVAEAEILNQLKVARRRFRQILADIVAETVNDEAELDDEMQALFGGGP